MQNNVNLKAYIRIAFSTSTLDNTCNTVIFVKQQT